MSVLIPTFNLIPILLFFLSNFLLCFGLIGNHPNWIPGTHNISMNLRLKMSNQPEEKQRRLWQLLVFNADSDDIAIKHTLNLLNNEGYSQRSTNYDNGGMFYPGSGHPSFHSNGRLVSASTLHK